MSVGGAGTESGLPWQHLQCTGAIVYLPLRGLANGGILIGPSLMLPTGGRIDSYPSLKRGEGESWLDGRGERQRARQVVASHHHHASKQNTALMSFSFRGKKSASFGRKRVQFRRDFDPMSSSFLFLFSDTHTRSQMKHTHNPKCIQTRGSANKPDT